MPSDTPPGWTLVTGASAGIGAALAARLAGRGCNVIAAVRDPQRLRVRHGHGRVEAVRLDFDEPASIAAAAGLTADIVGGEGLAGLVNMAGIIVEGQLEALPPHLLRRQLEVNVVGPTLLTQALLPLIAAARGTIVNIGAISAWLTPPFYGPVAASKAALVSLSEALRLELAPRGIRVFLIEPGAMKTGIFATSRATRDAWLVQRPEMERRYRPALVAMEHAFEKAVADDPAVVVDAVLRVLCRRGRARSVVGKGTGAAVLLSRLPEGLRDRLVRSVLGLSRMLAPAG